MLDSNELQSTANQDNQNIKNETPSSEKDINNINHDVNDDTNQIPEVTHIFDSKNPEKESNQNQQNSPMKNNLHEENLQNPDSSPQENENTNSITQNASNNLNEENNLQNTNQNAETEIQQNSNQETPIQNNSTENNSKEQNSIKDESKPKTSENTYIVQKDETIQSIAIKFDTTVQWLKSANQLFSDLIFEGTILKVKPDEDDLPPAESFTCTRFDPDINFIPQEGKLIILDDTLLFEPDDKVFQPLLIDLSSYVESATMIHPANDKYYNSPEALYIFMLSYLDSSNDNKFTVVFFSAIRSDIEKMYSNTEEAAKKAKAKPKPPPDVTTTDTIQPPDVTTTDTIQPVIQIPRHNSAIVPEPKEIEIETSKLEPHESSRLTEKRYSMPILKPIKTSEESSLLSSAKIDKLRFELPYRYKNLNWDLLYRLSKDGTSYTTFYQKVEKKKPIFLIIKTNTHEIIGSFISTGFLHSKRYYGNGEIFVFHFNPQLEVFRWSSSSNQFFVSSTESDISVGGGGTAAIWIDGYFLDAYSEPCPTFKSPCLTKSSGFKIFDIEVWHLVQK